MILMIALGLDLVSEKCTTVFSTTLLSMEQRVKKKKKSKRDVLETFYED